MYAITIHGTGLASHLLYRLLQATNCNVSASKLGSQSAAKPPIEVSKRLYALNYFSYQLLLALGCDKNAFIPFRTIKTWVADNQAATLTFDADTVGIDPLGALITHGSLLDLLTSKKPISIQPKKSDIHVYAQAQAHPAFSYSRFNYKQSVLSAFVTGEFTPGLLQQRVDHNESIGLLPFNATRAMVIWSKGNSPEESDCCFDTAETSLKNYYPSIESIEERSIKPELEFRVSKAVVKDNVVIIGDSANMLHPLAGQGLNQAFAACFLLYDALLTHPNSSNRALALFSRKYFSIVRPLCHTIHGFQRCTMLPRALLGPLFSVGRTLPMIEKIALSHAAGLSLISKLHTRFPL